MRTPLFHDRIDWSALDLFGHVNNVAVSRFFQAARIAFMDSIGLRVFPGIRLGPILAHTDVDFRRQLHFPGSVRVHTRLKRIGNASITLEHALLDDGGLLAASSTETIVYFDFEHGKSLRVPDEIRRAAEEIGTVPDEEFPSFSK